MTVKNILIRIQDNPAFNELVPADLGLPNESELKKFYSDGIDNFSIPEQDPTNWLTFDPGDGTNSTPSWVSRYNGTYINPDTNASASYNARWELNSLIFKYGQESLPIYQTFGSNFEFNSSGGPRNLGYTNIGNDTWVRMNHQVAYQDATVGTMYRPHNEVWKEGSIELTIKPTKSNCTLLSGTIMSNYKSQAATFEPNADGNQLFVAVSQTGVVDPSGTGSDRSYDVKQEVKQTYGVAQDNLYANKYDVYYAPTAPGGTPIPYIYEDVESGLSLTSLDHTVRTFKVDLVNGLVRVSYEIYYGDTKKYIEFYGKTNLVNNEWHHLVINRPTPFTIKDGDNKYGGDGCIEIWVDGKLDARNYEITTNDPLPTPNVLFNDYTNPGILNYPQASLNLAEAFVEKQPWMVQEIATTNYEGGIRDFIFRQSIALSPHSIGLNHIYAIKNSPGSKIIKPGEATATAKIVQPTVSVNKKTILKLYWDSLLDDKTKCLDGLELDETYNVYSYNVAKKNIISPSQTFNLDLNDSTKTRTFLQNVKTAVGKHLFVAKPGIIVDAMTMDAGATTGVNAGTHKNFIDYTNDSNVVKQYFGDRKGRFISNLQYGGVYLNPGDRILLFNQPRFADNGVWIFNGPNEKMTRPTEIKLSEYKNALVYVSDGKYAGKTYIQTNEVTNIRKSAQKWIEVDNSISLSTSEVYPVHTTPWLDTNGNERFIDINTDINLNYDIIAFMNYPTESKDIVSALSGTNEIDNLKKYKDFITNLRIAVIVRGKSLYISSPKLAVDYGIVTGFESVPQMINTSGDAQSAAISPFESGEVAENYFDTHRNMKYHLATPLAGLTNRETYIMTDFVTYSPDRTESDYHIKYAYRQFGLLEGDEFYIPGLTTLPETLNEQLPGYLHNQKGVSNLITFAPNQKVFGTTITKLSNNVYDGSTSVSNPYDDNITTIAFQYPILGLGKVFVNCVENGYPFSRSDYNKAIIQNVTAGQNAETTQTAAWQYSTNRLNKKSLYDFSEITNLIGQTTPTNGGGGPLIQGQSHCSNGVIRKKTDNGNLQYQSDLYPEITEEYFETTEIPVLSMTWLGLKWLAE